MKKYFIAGLIILLPVALTILILVFLIDLLTNPFLDAVRNFLLLFSDRFPILENKDALTAIARLTILILLVVFIFILGVIARWFFFRWFMLLTNKILFKIPFVKTVYKVLKEIMTAFFSTDKKKAFQKSTIVPFPSKKSYCVGFVTGEIPPICEEKAGVKLEPVFVPTAPHPISGYLVMVPIKDVHDVNMTKEEVVKFTVSCGVIIPEDEKKTKASKGEE